MNRRRRHNRSPSPPPLSQRTGTRLSALRRYASTFRRLFRRRTNQPVSNNQRRVNTLVVEPQRFYPQQNEPIHHRQFREMRSAQNRHLKQILNRYIQNTPQKRKIVPRQWKTNHKLTNLISANNINNGNVIYTVNNITKGNKEIKVFKPSTLQNLMKRMHASIPSSNGVTNHEKLMNNILSRVNGKVIIFEDPFTKQPKKLNNIQKLIIKY